MAVYYSSEKKTFVRLIIFFLKKQCSVSHLNSLGSKRRAWQTSWLRCCMLTYADVCWHMLTYANVCKRRSQILDVMTRLRVRILEFLCLFLEAASNGVSEAGAHILEISAMACFSARSCFSLVLPHALASAMRGCLPGNRCSLFFICEKKNYVSSPSEQVPYTKVLWCK